MTRIAYRELLDPTFEIAARIERWENDAELIPFIRPSVSKEDQEKKHAVSVDALKERLRTNRIFLIYSEENLVGEINYQVDPSHLYQKVGGTAWIGITVGEKSARHKGIGTDAMRFIEREIRQQKLKRIELGVFEFNRNAQDMYLKLGFKEIGRIENFTFWNGRMWQDIRMEKYL
jgi:RimJ/RimL family protein N-acetyltransferase